jgi:hypothetical protein
MQLRDYQPPRSTARRGDGDVRVATWRCLWWIERVHGIQQATRNDHARDKQCYPLQNSLPHSSFLPVNHHYFKRAFASAPRAVGPPAYA